MAKVGKGTKFRSEGALKLGSRKTEGDDGSGDVITDDTAPATGVGIGSIPIAEKPKGVDFDESFKSKQRLSLRIEAMAAGECKAEEEEEEESSPREMAMHGGAWERVRLR